MRTVTLALLVALGCGGRSHAPAASVAGPPAVARDYSATQWIPARPTYVLAARKVRDAQRSLADVIDSIGGVVADVRAAEVSAALRALLAVDPLSPDALTAMGVDLDGGIAIFSETLQPTIAVHLSAPDQTQAFFDQLRADGLAAQSQIVDGVELFTARLPANATVSWAVDKDWMWVHFKLPVGADDGTTWLVSSRHHGAPEWAADWQWAESTIAARQVATPKAMIVGFVDPRGALAKLSARIPEASGCRSLVEPIGRLGFSADTDGHQIGVRIAVDVGPAAGSVARAILPAPEGFAATAAQAPLALQWNLDLDAVRGWLAPCAHAFGLDVTDVDVYGVRAGRILLQTFDPDDKDGTGVVALDLRHKRSLAGYLDQIPLRSKLEKTQTYGPHTGHRLSIPFGPTIEYVLTDSLALLGVGDGLLARVVGKGVGAAGPLFALDIQPAGLTPAAWRWLLGAAHIPQAQRIAERLHYLHDGHVTIRVDGTRIVLAATGSRS